jgi:hypothetical protein
MITRRGWLKQAGALAFGSVPGLGGCARQAVCDKMWFNAVGSDGIVPKRLTTPVDAADIVAAVRDAETRKGRVRMTGSGHSFSDVAMTADHMLSPRGLTSCLRLDRDRLRGPAKDDRHLVRTQSGATIHQLNRRLEAVGLAFSNLGGYDTQTIVGAASTGTHGSGLKFGPITSQIASFQVVVSGARMLQIEPASGISDPARYPCPLEEDPSITVELKQNDDLFYAMGVGLGCLGIVYAVVLWSVDLFWLHEERTLTTWEALTSEGGFLRRLMAHEGSDFESDLDHYEIYLDPYPHPLERTRAALLTKRYHKSERPAELSEKRGSGAALLEALGALLSPNDCGGQQRCGLIDAMAFLNETSAEGLIRNTLQSLRDPGYTNTGYRVFNAGDINLARVYGIELAFALSRTVEVVTRMFDIAKRQGTEHRRFHPAPISLRFVGKSSFFLAPQEGHPTTMMEIGLPVGGKGAPELLHAYESEMVGDLRCRPHWGLDLRELRGEDAVKKLWPDTWDRWRAAYCQLNATGVFDGELTDRLGLSARTCRP